eukprot:jgi/Botrbrau1/20059/Bobra.200_1s0063.1
MVLPTSSSMLHQAHYFCPTPVGVRGSNLNVSVRYLHYSLPRVQRPLVVCEASSRDVAPRAVATPDAPSVAQGTPPAQDVEDDSYGVFQLSYSLENEDQRLLRGWKETINIAVSGAAGQISNHLLSMLASGSTFGTDQPICLSLLGSDRSREAIEGVAMELEDSLYPLLRKVRIGTDPYKVFKDADWALLIGAQPRKAGMERSALLDINGAIFAEQGKALDAVAKKTVKIIVVGNPCNTNALIGMKNAPSIPKENWHALTRLDENRAKSQLSMKSGRFYTSVTNVAIWGNHSTTQVPDFVNARIAGKPATAVIDDEKWFKEEFTPQVANRGAALIKKWGKSSASSTAVSIADAIKSLITPTPPGDCFSTAVCTDGNPYGIAEGLVFSMPCRSKGDGNYEVIPDFEIDDWLRAKLKTTEDELIKERNCVGHLIPNAAEAYCEITEDTMLPGEN